MPAMTAHRRVIEDRADEARECIERLETVRRDFLTQIEISQREVKWLGIEAAAHLIDFLNTVRDAMGDDLFLAQRSAEKDAQAFDTSAADRRAMIPGSY